MKDIIKTYVIPTFVVLLIFLGVCTLLDAEAPTYVVIEQVYQSEPEVIYEMVRKLWVLEQTPATVIVPDIVIAYLTDSTVEVAFSGPIKVQIGEGEYVLEYDVPVSSQNVSYGTRPRLPPWVLPTVTGVGGLIVGALVAGLLTR